MVNFQSPPSPMSALKIYIYSVYTTFAIYYSIKKHTSLLQESKKKHIFQTVYFRRLRKPHLQQSLSQHFVCLRLARKFFKFL